MNPPNDLDADESVFQIRFTKELFRDYEEYMKRLNLYRQRVWTCRVTGKSNLTYEETLVSEHHATEKVREFPKDLIAPVIQMIQFIQHNMIRGQNEGFNQILSGKFDVMVQRCKCGI